MNHKPFLILYLLRQVWNQVWEIGQLYYWSVHQNMLRTNLSKDFRLIVWVHKVSKTVGSVSSTVAWSNFHTQDT